MNLGFYYHVAAIEKDGKMYLPGYLGFFLDSLAGQVTRLTLILHEAQGTASAYCDYQLQADNIVWINLGLKKPAWHRFLFGSLLLRKFAAEIQHCNAVLVRAPSPLASAFYHVFHKKTHVVFLLVGDYLSGIKHLELPALRKWAIGMMSVSLDRTLKKAAQQCCILVNSQQIFDEFRPYAKSLHLVRTTTLRLEDFSKREDTCQGAVTNILYVGRYDFAKGLRELLEATHQLIQQGRSVHLHVAGWEDAAGQPVATWLEAQTKLLGMAGSFTNHGKKKSGAALNELYRTADIFILPSYHEGFPRVIWEAMANSVPVIATTVGSIPFYLHDNTDSLLIPAQSASAIVEKVNYLLDNPHARQSLISHGYALAEENTLQIQTKKLWNIIEQHLAVDALEEARG